MAVWVGNLQRRMKDAKSKAFTLLWYKWMFYKMGSHSAISPPFYPYKPENVEIGNRVYIGPNCRIETHPVPSRVKSPRPILKIGDRVKIGHGCNLSCQQSLVIEDEALIAGGCYISDNNHSIDPEGPSYAEQPLTLEGAGTVIGKGVWLGQNVCVLAGSYIGERSIIGAGSVVNGYIPPYCIAVGAPAKVVKQYQFETKEWKRVTHSEAMTKMIKGV